MCIVLKPDFIVGITVEHKKRVKELLNKEGPIVVTISDCLDAQANCKRYACGNIIAESTPADFKLYFKQNPQIFKQKLNPENYEVLCSSVSHGTRGGIDYDKFLNLGIYNDKIKAVFGYPRATCEA